jgi:hypothetical protein
MEIFKLKMCRVAQAMAVCWCLGLSVQPSHAQTVGVAPPNLTYGVPTAGTTSAVESVTVSVTGNTSPVTFGTASVTGPFVIATDSCSGATLIAPAACMVGVTYTALASPPAPALQTGTLSIPDGMEGGLSVPLSGAAGAIKLFDPFNVANSRPGLNFMTGNTFAFGNKPLNLSCAASPITAKLASTPDGVGNVLVDNFVQVTVNSTTTDVCNGGDSDAGPNGTIQDCFTDAYRSGTETNGDTGLDGQDPDNFTGPGPSTLGAAGGVPPLNVSGLLPAGPSQATFSLVDGGGKVASSTIFLVTNCTSPGVASGGTISSNPINSDDPGSQTPQFTFDATPGQHITFGADYLALAGTSAITDGTVANTGDTGLTQAQFGVLVAGTSAAPAQCILVKGELAPDGVTPLCKAFTIECTTPSNLTPAGVNCPQSSVRNLLFETRFDAASAINIAPGTGPGFVMGTDNWVASAANCTFTDPTLVNQLCPQNPLVEFKGADDPTHGSTPRATNSTFIPVLNMPLPFTLAYVASENLFLWQNTVNVKVKFLSFPAIYPFFNPIPANGFKAAPIQSLTFGLAAATSPVPDPTFPVAGDTTLYNSGGSTAGCSSTPGGSFASSSTLTLSEGRFKLHYFATDCASTEELRFTTSTNPNVNWASFKTVPVNIDVTKPTAQIISVSPSNPVAGQTVTVTYECTDPKLADGNAGSGVLFCGTHLFFGAADTGVIQSQFKAGKHSGLASYSVTATDLAGNTFTTTASYTIQ